MATATRNKARKSLSYCRWLLPAEAVMFNFATDIGAELIVSIDGREDLYSVRPRLDGELVVAWHVVKLIEDGGGTQGAEEYVLPGDLSGCTCPWHANRPHAQPCRHRRFLRAAVAWLGYEM